MQDWLKSLGGSDQSLDWATVLGRQAFAVLFGFAVAAAYRITKNGTRDRKQSLMGTLVVLTLLIAMISSVIGDNVARAFSLVGALSIVRFRTVVEETQDVAFVILAVGVGMAVGAGYYIVPLTLIPVAGAACWLFADRRHLGLSRTVEVTIRTNAGFDISQLPPRLESFARTIEQISVSSARQGALTEMHYRLEHVSVAQLNALYEAFMTVEGVASVEVQAVAV